MQHLRHQLFIAASIVLVASLLITLTIKSLLPNDDKIIDQAIKQRDPGLCEKVKRITMPGPQDETVVVTGESAVKECKNLVEFGSRLR